ncbi:MAG: sugar nucleotide-binding protein, partial [Alphaproteobacteria bacterium]
IGERSARQNMSNVIHISAIGADLNSPSLYARTKAQGEAALRKAFPDAVILRPSLVFGAGDGFFNRFAAMAVMAPGLPLIGGGNNKVQPVYVGDVAASVIAALTNPKAKGNTYELGGPAVMRFRDAMAYILEQTKRRRLLIPVPHAVMTFAASAMAILPNPPVTRDQLKLLKVDNVVGDDAKGLDDLGINPTPIELIVPSYLQRYQPGGRFA